MRHRVAGRHLGRDTAHRRALFRNLVTDFLRYERIRTTEAKAKEIRPLAEKMITLAKRGDLHARRQALRFVYDPQVVQRTFDEIAPRMAARPGGYTRITALEPRKGDGARMAVLEMVDLEDVAMPRPERATATATPAPADDVAEEGGDDSIEAVEAAEEADASASDEAATADGAEAETSDDGDLESSAPEGADETEEEAEVVSEEEAKE